MGSRTVRLMSINPYQESSTALSCQLQPTCLDSAPSYEALSYCWGEERGGLIQCSGKKLDIRRNLEDALNRLRLAHGRRTMWTDAICINQEDGEEKKEQIKLMRELYSKATRVLIWLGKDSKNQARRAVDRIERIAQQENDLLPPQHPWWNVVAAFYRCKWFSRLWVFQEIAVATDADVLWGASHISWRTVGRATVRIRILLHQQILRRSMMNVYHGYMFYKWSAVSERPNSPETFLYMLQITRKLQCSYPRDRIYALSGFETLDAFSADFCGQFDQRKRLQTVYQEFARKVLRRMQTLDLLSAVQHRSDQPGIRKCTWAPKWDVCTADTLAPLGLNYERYHASRGLTIPSIQWTGNWEQFLRTEGFEFGKIVNTSEVMADLTSLRKLRAKLSEVSTDFLSRITSYPTGESATHVCCWILTAGKDEYGMIVENMAQHRADFAAFRAKFGRLAQQSLYRLQCEEGLLNGDIDRFLMAARSACSGRRLFYTSDGYAGIGPAISKAGDKICVFAGGAMPFVLRQDSHSNPQKRRLALVGEAYVHGIMHGEAVSQHCDRNRATVAFDII